MGWSPGSYSVMNCCWDGFGKGPHKTLSEACLGLSPLHRLPCSFFINACADNYEWLLLTRQVYIYAPPVHQQWIIDEASELDLISASKIGTLPSLQYPFPARCMPIYVKNMT